MVLYLFDIISDCILINELYTGGYYIYASLTTFFVVGHYPIMALLMLKFLEPLVVGADVPKEFNWMRTLGYIALFPAALWMVPLTDLYMLILPIIVERESISFLQKALYFMDNYERARFPLECFCQSVPQTILQLIIFVGPSSSNKPEDIELSALLPSLISSFMNAAKCIIMIYLASKASGLGWRYLLSLIRLEGSVDVPESDVFLLKQRVEGHSSMIASGSNEFNPLELSSRNDPVLSKLLPAQLDSAMEVFGRRMLANYLYISTIEEDLPVLGGGMPTGKTTVVSSTIVSFKKSVTKQYDPRSGNSKFDARSALSKSVPRTELSKAGAATFTVDDLADSDSDESEEIAPEWDLHRILSIDLLCFGLREIHLHCLCVKLHDLVIAPSESNKRRFQWSPVELLVLEDCVLAEPPGMDGDFGLQKLRSTGMVKKVVFITEDPVFAEVATLGIRNIEFTPQKTLPAFLAVFVPQEYHYLESQGATESKEAFREDLAMLAHCTASPEVRKAMTDSMSTIINPSYIELSNLGMLDCDCCALSSALSLNRTITEINMSHNKVTSRGVSDLSHCLSLHHGTHLISLELSDNHGLGDPGALALGAALPQLTALYRLMLERAGIQKAGLEGLLLAMGRLMSCHEQLKETSLAGNEVNALTNGSPAQWEAMKLSVMIDDNVTGDRHWLPASCRDQYKELMDSFYAASTDDFNLGLSSLILASDSCTMLNVVVAKLLSSRVELGGAAPPLGTAPSEGPFNLTIQGVSAVADAVVLPLCDLAMLVKTGTLVLDLAKCGIGPEGCGVLKDALRCSRVLISINLSANQLDDAACVDVCEAIVVNVVLKHIDMSGNGIGDEGALAMAKCLTVNHTLTSVLLDDNQIGDAGGVALGEALRQNKTLLELGLSKNGISVGGCDQLGEALTANSVLQVLAVHGNSGTTCCKVLSRALRRSSPEMAGGLAHGWEGSDDSQGSKVLKAIHLMYKHFHTDVPALDLWQNCRLGADGSRALAYALMRSGGLAQLNLANNGLGAVGCGILCEALAVNSSLRSLTLQSNGIEDEGLGLISKALMTNTTLCELRLQSNGIGPAGCAALAGALAQHASLAVLDLYSNGIGPEGCTALADVIGSSTVLTHLYLMCNNIKADGCKTLSEALKKNTSLKVLNVFANAMGPDGCKAMGALLNTYTSLHTLIMGNNNIGDDGCVALAEGLDANTNTSTNTSTNTNTTPPQVLNVLANAMGPDGCKAMGAALNTNTSLHTLIMDNNNVGDDGCVALAEGLDANTNTSTNTSTNTNTNTTPPQVLNVFANAMGPDGCKAMGAALNTNTSLHTLIMDNNNVGDDGCVALAEGLCSNPTLTELWLSQNGIEDERGKALGEALKRNVALQLLQLQSNGIADEGLKSIGAALKSNGVLKTLNLESNAIGLAGCELLGQGLEVNKSLTKLDLQNNGVGADACGLVTAALAVNSTLKHLNLRNNGMGAEGAQVLGEALCANSALTSLNLQSNGLKAEGCASLAPALAANTTLTSLVLDYNNIGDEGCVALGGALKVNSTLEVLHLASNRIGPEGTKALGEALSLNRALRHLFLQSNTIGPEGAKALATALTTNNALQQLNLQSSSIGNEGCIALATALETEGIALQHLFLQANKITVDGAKALAQALQKNLSLQWLNIQSNQIGAAGKKELSHPEIFAKVLGL
eukprot:gene26415-17514_t